MPAFFSIQNLSFWRNLLIFQSFCAFILRCSQTKKKEIFFHVEKYFLAIYFSFFRAALFHGAYVNLKLHNLVKQLSTAQSHFLCSFRNIPVGSLQRIQDELPVEIGPGFLIA